MRNNDCLVWIVVLLASERVLICVLFVNIEYSFANKLMSIDSYFNTEGKSHKNDDDDDDDDIRSCYAK